MNASIPGNSHPPYTQKRAALNAALFLSPMAANAPLSMNVKLIGYKLIPLFYISTRHSSVHYDIAEFELI